jgi:hypothetical protein
MNFLYIVGVFINLNNIITFHDKEKNTCVFEIQNNLIIEEVIVDATCHEYFKNNIVFIGKTK